MSRLNRKEILEGIGVFSIVASLVFVGLQVNQSQREGEGSELIAYVELIGEMRVKIIDNAGVWHKACSGAELLPAEKIIASQIYKSYAEFAFTAGIISDVGVAQDFPEFLINRYAANYHRYPGFAALMNSHGAWVKDGERGHDDPRLVSFYNKIMQRVAELRVIEPNPDYDLMWCGI